jgi:hypothetical protein
VARRHTKEVRPAGQAGGHGTAPSTPAGKLPEAPGTNPPRPVRDSAPDPLALLVAAVVLAAIALAAWLALFRRR